VGASTPGRGDAVRPGGVRSALAGAGEPQGLDECGPLRDQLALILPELGEPAPESDRPTLFEAVRAALAHVAREKTTVVVLDDLQWSDEATLELLPALAESVSDLQLLIFATYRSDGSATDSPRAATSRVGSVASGRAPSSRAVR
jgi:AAA ATPase domain